MWRFGNGRGVRVHGIGRGPWLSGGVRCRPDGRTGVETNPVRVCGLLVGVARCHRVGGRRQPGSCRPGGRPVLSRQAGQLQARRPSAPNETLGHRRSRNDPRYPGPATPTGRSPPPGTPTKLTRQTHHHPRPTSGFGAPASAPCSAGTLRPSPGTTHRHQTDPPKPPTTSSNASATDSDGSATIRSGPSSTPSPSTEIR